MKYLILGGNGFIGSHLVKALCDDGHFVRLFDRSIDNIETTNNSIECTIGDFTDTFSIAEALTGIDVVYHLISTTVPSTSNLDMVNDVQTNLISTIRLLQTMKEVGVKKIVFLSSGGTVYGNTDKNPIPENHPLNPICSYGIVKAAIENYLFLFHKLDGFEYNILRVSNPYGANQQHFGVQGVIPTFLQKVYKNEPITIWGDGTIERDYIYINDLIDVCVKAGAKMHNTQFNIGSGLLTSINNIIETIKAVTGKEIKIKTLPQRNFDVKSISLDCTEAKSKFEWLPVYDLTKGIEEYWKSIKP